MKKQLLSLCTVLLMLIQQVSGQGIDKPIYQIVTYRDTAYLGAMMQDTGIIVLAKRGEAGALDGSLADNGHPALGAAVLRNWKLPANVASAVGVHHNSDGAKKLGGDIHALACLMAAGRRLRDGESGEWTTWASPCKEDYGIDNDFLEAPIANLPDAD